MGQGPALDELIGLGLEICCPGRKGVNGALIQEAW